MKPPKLVGHVSEADRSHAALSHLHHLLPHQPPPEARVIMSGSAVYVPGNHDRLKRMQEMTRVADTADFTP